MAKDLVSGKMEIDMTDIGKKENKMAKELTSGKMDINMSDNGKKEKNMAKPRYFLRMNILIKVYIITQCTGRLVINEQNIYICPTHLLPVLYLPWRKNSPAVTFVIV